MYIRNLKIVFIVLIALLCLVYAGQNVANLDSAYQSFAYVMGGADHVAYPATFGAVVSTPGLIWLALVVVVVSEFLAGLLALKGAFDLWSNRKSSVESFQQAKKFGLLACGLGMIIWGGFFGVIGGAYFQMWQTQIGDGSMRGAFQFFVTCAIVFIIVLARDEAVSD